jgi:hypothetical protein
MQNAIRAVKRKWASKGNDGSSYEMIEEGKEEAAVIRTRAFLLMALTLSLSLFTITLLDPKYRFTSLFSNSCCMPNAGKVRDPDRKW